MKRVLALAALTFFAAACGEQFTPTSPKSALDPSGSVVPEGIHPMNAAALGGASYSRSADGLGISATHVSGHGAFVSNGTIQIGVRPTGDLNVPGGTRSVSGTSTVGLRYLASNAEATAAGCTCEGWGVGDRLTGAQGSANSAVGGYPNLVVESFSATATEATSITRAAGKFRVTHHYRPSPSTPNLYEVNVTIENISSANVDVIYRRVMDWDIEPTPFREFVTIERGTSTDLFRTDNNGFNPGNPFAFGSAGYLNVNFTDVGPRDHGALFDFTFGVLAPGAKKEFKTYYGAAGTEIDAKAALGAVGAEVYSFGQPSTAGGPTLGTPNTFIFAFGGVGGRPVEPPPTPSNVAPEADAGDDQTLFRTSSAGATVSLDGSGSSDSDGNIVEYLWSVSGTTIATGVTPTHTFGLGTHVVKLTVKDDDGATDEDFVTIVVKNVPPTAFAGADITGECIAGGAAVQLNGRGSDIDGTIASYLWTPGGATTASTTQSFALGSHTATLTVTDNDGAQDSDNVQVNVVDTQKPVISMTVSPTELWAPNHKMVKVASGVSASDACDSSPSLAVSVTSNEPVNDIGDGNTAPDWDVVSNSNGTYDVFVRAERSGTGTGRIYTITATSVDGSGNSSSSIATVTVPHDKRRR